MPIYTLRGQMRRPNGLPMPAAQHFYSIFFGNVANGAAVLGNTRQMQPSPFCGCPVQVEADSHGALE